MKHPRQFSIGLAAMALIAGPALALATTWYLDQDGDSWGLCAVTVEADAQPPGYAAICGDCNDANSNVHPGAIEIPADGADQNCDGRELCHADMDSDWYGTITLVVSLDLDCIDRGESTNAADCNDLDATIYPGATEIPNDGIDQDCDGHDLVLIGLEPGSWSLIKNLYR
jgi:hypothetical protein